MRKYLLETNRGISIKQQFMKYQQHREELDRNPELEAQSLTHIELTEEEDRERKRLEQEESKREKLDQEGVARKKLGSGRSIAASNMTLKAYIFGVKLNMKLDK